MQIIDKLIKMIAEFTLTADDDLPGYPTIAFLSGHNPIFAVSDCCPSRIRSHLAQP